MAERQLPKLHTGVRFPSPAVSVFFPSMFSVQRFNLLHRYGATSVKSKRSVGVIRDRRYRSSGVSRAGTGILTSYGRVAVARAQVVFGLRWRVSQGTRRIILRHCQFRTRAVGVLRVPVGITIDCKRRSQASILGLTDKNIDRIAANRIHFVVGKVKRARR